MSGRITLMLVFAGIALVSGCGKQPEPKPATPTVDTPRATAATAESQPTAVAEKTPDQPADMPAGDQTAKQGLPEAPAEAEPKPAPSLKEMLKRAENGVVVVEVFNALDEKIAFGTGCLIGKGLVLTNFHVIADAVTAKVQAKGSGEELLGAPQAVLGYRVLDQHNDLAVLAVDGLPDAMQILPLADPVAIEQYDKVFAIGHPDGIKFSTTPGFVNSLVKTGDLPEQLQAYLRGTKTEWIQTDAVIAGGSSGGPLLNERGEIVGINTLQVGNRIGLAVRVQHVQELLKKLTSTSQTTPLPVPDADVLTTKSVAEIKQGYEREYSQFVTDLQAVRETGDLKKLQELVRRNNPGPACIQRCLELVKSHRGRAEADDAVRMSAMILLTSAGRPNSGRHYLDRVLQQIAEDPTTIQSPAAVVSSLLGLTYSPELELFLRTVIASDATDNVKGAAGAALVTAMNAAQDEAMSAEMLELATSTRDNYGDVLYRGSPLREYLDPLIDAYAFAIGNEAPDIVGKDADGKEFRLSEYRGKVVVIDFWADWCPHCRNMYQHEREMIERLKDQPFALLGVNGDETARAKRTIAAGEVTWRSWLDGPTGPISTQYKVESWPTVFILDKSGRIRFKDLRGEEMESAVNSLLTDTSYLDGAKIVAANATWRFDTASKDMDQESWKDVAFNDSQWNSGAGPFGNELETTRLEQQPAGQRPLTTLFRTRFDAPAGELPEQLLMQLRFRDGMAIYLNGKEVYRNRLHKSATFESGAIERAPRMEVSGATALIASNLLKPKDNVLAVEVHLFSKYSKRSLFELTLEAPPVLPELMAKATPAQQTEICQLLTEVGGLPGTVEILKTMQSNTSPDLQLRAAVAAALNELPISLKKRSDPAVAQALAQYVVALNLSAWNTVQRDDLTESQYVASLRVARAAHALTPLVHSQLKPLTEAVANTYAVALIRSAQYDKALEILNRSIKQRGENPVDVAYVCLAHSRLGNTAEAQQARDQLAKLMESEDWRHNSEAQAAYREIERAFAGSEKNP